LVFVCMHIVNFKEVSALHAYGFITT